MVLLGGGGHGSVEGETQHHGLGTHMAWGGVRRGSGGGGTMGGTPTRGAEGLLRGGDTTDRPIPTSTAGSRALPA